MYLEYCRSLNWVSLIRDLATVKEPRFQCLYLWLSIIACIYVCLHALSCLTLCNPMDYSPSGSSVHGIFQSRILKWVQCHFLQGIFLISSCIFCFGRWILYHHTNLKFVMTFNAVSAAGEPQHWTGIRWALLEKQLFREVPAQAQPKEFCKLCSATATSRVE